MLEVRTLRQLARPPDAIVCIVGDMRSTAATAESKMPDSERRVFEDLADQVFDVDVFVVVSPRSFLKEEAKDDSGVYSYQNWLNETVHVIKLPPDDEQASRVEHTRFMWAGRASAGDARPGVRRWPRLHPGATASIALNCSVDTHRVDITPDHGAFLSQRRVAETHFFTAAIGHLDSGGFDGQRLRPGTCTTLSREALALAIPEDSCRGQAAIVATEAALVPARAAPPSWTSCGCYVAQCAAGSLIADAYALRTTADVAFVNAGAIGASLPENVTLQAVQGLVTYNDVLAHGDVPGTALRLALAHSVGVLGRGLSDVKLSGGRFLQVSSSLRFEWHFNSRGVAVLGRVRVQRRGALEFTDLDDNATYSLTTNTFVASGGDGFSDLAAALQLTSGRLFNDVGLGRSAVREYLVTRTSPQHRLRAPTKAQRITQIMPMEAEPEGDTPYRRRTTDIIAIVCTYVFGLALFVTIVLACRKHRARNKAVDLSSLVEELKAEDLLPCMSLRNPHEIPSRCLQIMERVGDGNFGEVYKGRLDWRNSAKAFRGSHNVAVKRALAAAGALEAAKAELLKEAVLTAQFDHPNVLRLLGVVTCDKRCDVVLQFCEKGSLRELLLNDKLNPQGTTHIPESVSLKIAADVAKGMAYLETRCFVHRDLAARNILVSADDTCLVGDFGMSRQLKEGKEYYKVREDAKVRDSPGGCLG